MVGFRVPGKFTTIETEPALTERTAKSLWDYRLPRSEILMSSQDVQMTDLIRSANVLRKHPTQRPTTPRTGIYRNAAKRVFDITLVLLSLPAVLPLILVLAALVALNCGTPFYRQ